MKYTSLDTGTSRESLEEDCSITGWYLVPPARNNLRESFEKGFVSSKMTVSRESIDSTLTAYNNFFVLRREAKQETLVFEAMM